MNGRRRDVSLVSLWRRAVLSADLPSMQKLVAAVLAEYANGTSLEVWPWTGRLANGLDSVDPSKPPKAHTGLAARTIVYARQGLVESGWLAVVAERRGSSTIYRLAFPEAVAATALLGVTPAPAAGGSASPAEGSAPAAGGSASPAAEVEQELDPELVHEVEGHLQMKLDGARLRPVEACFVCGEPAEREYGSTGLWFCTQHRQEQVA